MQDKRRNFYLWALYDFANSIVLMGFLFYFSQWLVVDHGRPAWWYNAALVGSSLLFIITAPALSRRIDATKRKIAGLRWWTLIAFLAHLAVALITALASQQELLVTLLYTFAVYSYLTCFLYFTPMLNDLSSDSDRSWKSGLGQSANTLGQIAGILIVLPFVNGLTLLGTPGRAQALLVATLVFGLLALPMLLWYREEKGVVSGAVSAGSSNLFSLFRAVFGYRPLALLLLSYFLFSDALITFANNFPLYLETVHGVSDTIKSILTAAILVLSAVGSLVGGKLADRRGNLRVLKLLLGVWCGLFLILSFVTNFHLLIPLFIFAGLVFGPVWSVSRALVGELAPPHLVASSYSYYVVAERFATFVGPAVWSLALIVAGENARGYQLAFFLLTILIVVSAVVLGRIRGREKGD